MGYERKLFLMAYEKTNVKFFFFFLFNKIFSMNIKRKIMQKTLFLFFKILFQYLFLIF